MNRRFLLFVSVVAPCLAIDRLSKAWAERELFGRGVLTLVPGALDFRYARNRGAFFSMGEHLDAGLRRALFVIASVLALALVTGLYRRAALSQLRTRLALGLLAGGIAGNLVDRVRDGEVVDFIYLHAGMLLQWATFNFADVWIVIGLALLAIDLTRSEPDPGRAGRITSLKPAGTDGGN